MPEPRFYLDAPLAAGDSLALPREIAHHALHVLRLRAGAAIVLFNGRGGEFRGALRVDGEATIAELSRFDPVERESPLALTLIQSLVAADKLDLIVEKAVELGVARVIVVPAQRSVVRLDDARSRKRLQHWRDVARAACCQCGRNRVPDIALIAPFERALAAVTDDQPRLMLEPAAPAALPASLPERRIALLVGPEGGFSEAEGELAARRGFLSVGLGPRILRTETAGLAALASLQAMHGDLTAAGNRSLD